jgi:hypothetical protein
MGPPRSKSSPMRIKQAHPSQRCPYTLWLLVLATVFALAGAACGEAELGSTCLGSACDEDVAGDTASDPRQDPGSDASPDNGGGGGDTGADVGGSDADEDAEIEPGAFGAPCEENGDCLSGFCILGLEGSYICTQLCVDSCPAEGYSCQLIRTSGADLVNICYPLVQDLCKPCDADFECGGLADRCVELEDGSYCATDCQVDGLCPPGFDCRDYDGARQCMPESNFCSDCFDQDEDGYGVGEGCLGVDCQDLDDSIFEGAPELCDFKDNDCDLNIDEDIDVTRDPNNCGGCNIRCTLPNAVNICVSSECFIQSCNPGYYDLDDEAPGCEYNCVDENLSIVDEPDSDYADTNCDGIDGDIETSIFVNAVHGNPDGSGDIDDPVNTIWRGIALAQATAGARPNVLVAEGSYTGQTAEQALRVADGISVFGGYDAVTWRRSTENLTLIGGAATAVEARDIVTRTVLSQLTIQADTGTTLPGGRGENSIALLAINANALEVVDCVLTGGNGGPGANGVVGDRGRDGENGGPGSDGNVDSSGTCPSSAQPTRGSAGPSSCSPGGQGGNTERSEGSGGEGSDAGSVQGGPGGRGGGDNWTGAPDRDGDDGSPGCSATSTFSYCTTVPAVNNGANGGAGDAAGIVQANGLWVGRDGNDGGDGDDGYGGGGGGGGGGATGDCSGGGFGDLLETCDGWGGSGGGGGGGGCGGTGGTGGGAGGGSFGLFLVDSAPLVVNTDITSRGGGRGGDGGRGGGGGDAGNGAAGGSSFCNGGSGGRGGNGTDGGSGGHGGGGGGGVSYAVFLVDSSDEHFSDVNTLFGLGGSGGGGPGNGGATGDTGSVRRATR